MVSPIEFILIIPKLDQFSWLCCFTTYETFSDHQTLN